MPEAIETEQPQTVKVCLASMSFYPLYAGPAVRFQRYAPGLAKRGVQTCVLTRAVTQALLERDGSLTEGDGPGAGSPSGHGAEWPLFEIVDGIPVQRLDLPSGWRSHAAFFHRLVHYCKRSRTAIDVVQFLSLDIWAAPWLWRLRRLGVGTVFTHTLLGDLSPKPWKRMLQRIHRRSPLQLVDRIVVSSSVMRRQLKDLGVSTPIQVIPNGVDLRRFRPAASQHDKANLRRQLDLHPDWDIILAVGPIIPRKGVEAVVQAFASICHYHPRARLILVGPRHDQTRATLSEFGRHLQHKITSAGAQDRVIFTGPVAHVQDYMQAADLLVFASRREGMPNVVPEAMACGLPVIMTPFIGLPEEFGYPDTHYILSDWAPATLGRDIQMLLKNRQRRWHLGHAARRWVEENLDVEQSLTAYANMYGSMQNYRVKSAERCSE